MLSVDFLSLGFLNLMGQELAWPDLLVVGLLVILEGVLSIDNALVLGLLAKRLPKHLRPKALSYGLIGAFVFRVLAIATASFLLQWTFIKFLGGGYLVFIAVKHLFFESKEQTEGKVVIDQEGQPQLVDAATGSDLPPEQEEMEIEARVPIGASLITEGESSEQSAPTCKVPSFWGTVLVIELTDIAFAVDSILAAMALAGSRQEKLWVVISGGILGVVLMRFAAAVFIRLLDRFPRFELSAYLLVIVIGLKLLADWGFNSDWSFQHTPWLASRLGSYQETFKDIETTRRDAVARYEGWLRANWPLGMAEPHGPSEHLGSDLEVESVPDTNTNGDSSTTTDGKIKLQFVPHLLDFHDLRRPECLTFWFLMLVCFNLGFIGKKPKEAK